MPALCGSPILGTVARVWKQNVCCNPVTGAGVVAVTEGFVSVEITREYEEGPEIVVRTASGALCVNHKQPSNLKRVAPTINFCKVDPEIIALMTTATVLTTGGPATGTGVAWGEEAINSQFSLELWQEIAGTDACSAGGVKQYMYWAMPCLTNGRLGDLTIEEGAATFSVQAESKGAGGLWGAGPSAQKWSPTIAAGKHIAFNIIPVAPPAVTGCGLQTG